MRIYYLFTILLTIIFLNSCSLTKLYKNKNKQLISEEKTNRLSCPLTKIPNETSRLINNANYPGESIKIIRVLSSCKYKKNPSDRKLDLFVNFAVQLEVNKLTNRKKDIFNKLMIYVAIVEEDYVKAKILIPISKNKMIEETKDKAFIEIKNKFKFTKEEPKESLVIYYGIQTIRPQLTESNYNNRK